MKIWHLFWFRYHLKKAQGLVIVSGPERLKRHINHISKMVVHGEKAGVEDIPCI